MAPVTPGLRSRWAWLCLVLVLVGLDQVTKAWVSQSLALGQRVSVLPVFDLIYMHNRGAAFSFLAGASGWQRWFLSAIAVVASVVLTVWLWRLQAGEKRMALTLALLLGGALGNLIDRLRFGYVEDFILLHWRGATFPAFNLADMAITAGAVLLIADALITTRHTSNR